MPNARRRKPLTETTSHTSSSDGIDFKSSTYAKASSPPESSSTATQDEEDPRRALPTHRADQDALAKTHADGTRKWCRAPRPSDFGLSRTQPVYRCTLWPRRLTTRSRFGVSSGARHHLGLNRSEAHLGRSFFLRPAGKTRAGRPLLGERSTWSGDLDRTRAQSCPLWIQSPVLG